MSRIPKKRKVADTRVDATRMYGLDEAMGLVKEVNTARFDASVDIHVRLGVDPRKADQALRGTVSLPHGTGKTKRVLALVTPDKEAEAREAGADHIGLDEYIQKIADGWTDVDVIVAMPTVMAQLGKIGRILGPRGLMPNPKTGTVSFSPQQLLDNANELLGTLVKMKPSTAKGTYIKTVTVASTMSPGIKIETRSIKQ